MSPGTERFLDLAVGPPRPGKGDEERHARMRGALLERLHDHRPGPDELTLEQATERLEQQRTRPRLSRLRAILVVLLPFAVLLAAAYVELPDYYLEKRPPSWMPGFLEQRIAQRWASLAIRPLPVDRRGGWPMPIDTSQGPGPNDPESLQLKIAGKIQNRTKIPPELADAFHQADPGNAWLPLSQANLLAEKAVGSPGMKMPLAIIDPDAARQALDLCEQALLLPKFVSYLGRPYQRQRPAIRRPRTKNESEAIYALLPSESGAYANDRLSKLFEIQARTLMAAGDLPGVAHLTTMAARIEVLQLTQPGAGDADYSSYLVQLDNRNLVKELTKSAPAETFAVLHDAGARRKEAAKRFRVAVNGTPEADPQAGMKAHLYPVVPYSDISYYAPLRAGAAVLTRTYAFPTALGLSLLVLLFSTCVAIARRRPGAARTASHLAGLYGWAVYGRTFLFGFVLPLTGWWLVLWQTRLGCLDLPASFVDPDHLANFPRLGQLLGAPVLVFTTSLQWARVERGRHFAFLGLKPARLGFGWVMVVLAALTPALYGLARFYADPSRAEPLVQIVAALQGLSVLWLLWRTLALLFDPRTEALGAFLSGRLVTPVLSVLAVAVSLAIFLCQAQERHWMRQDPAVLQPGEPSSSTRSRGIYREIMRAEFADELK